MVSYLTTIRYNVTQHGDKNAQGIIQTICCVQEECHHPNVLGSSRLSTQTGRGLEVVGLSFMDVHKRHAPELLPLRKSNR